MFGRILRKVCLEFKDEIASRFGYKISDIGVHSWRKCAHSKLYTGSTAGPPAAAACLRGGHKIGGSKDYYIQQEKATDTFCGKLLAGLPEHSEQFAMSYPEFIPIERLQSIEDGGVPVEDYMRRQQEVNDQVQLALNSIFGEENLTRFRQITPILRVGLASHLQHLDYYNALIDASKPELGKNLPDSSPLRRTPLFTDPMISTLKEHVRIAMPHDGHYKFFAPATGLPPHVLIYSYLKGLQKEMRDGFEGIPKKIEEILDRRTMNGQLSLDQLTRAVENGPLLTSMAGDLARLTNLIQQNGMLRSDDGGGGAQSTLGRPNIRLVCEYRHSSDGKSRRVPSTWKFPSLPLQNMYQYWHTGDESNKIPPMKWFQNEDVDFLKRGRINLSECRKVMTAIDNESERKGVSPRDIMTHVETNTCYYKGESAILAVVPTQTNCDRVRNVSRLRWSTVVRFMRKKRGT